MAGDSDLGQKFVLLNSRRAALKLENSLASEAYVYGTVEEGLSLVRMRVPLSLLVTLLAERNKQ